MQTRKALPVHRVRLRLWGLPRKLNVADDPTLAGPERADLALKAVVKVITRHGDIYRKSVDFPRGVPENPLTKEEHVERFQNCISYSGKLLHEENIQKIVPLVDRLGEVEDVRSLIPLLLTQGEKGV